MTVGVILKLSLLAWMRCILETHVETVSAQETDLVLRKLGWTMMDMPTKCYSKKLRWWKSLTRPPTLFRTSWSCSLDWERHHKQVITKFRSAIIIIEGFLWQLRKRDSKYIQTCTGLSIIDLFIVNLWANPNTSKQEYLDKKVANRFLSNSPGRSFVCTAMCLQCIVYNVLFKALDCVVCLKHMVLGCKG